MNILELCIRKDGFLTRSSGEIDALRESGRVTTTDIGDGYLIARSVQPRSAPYRYRHDAAERVRAEIGGGM